MGASASAKNPTSDAAQLMPICGPVCIRLRLEAEEKGNARTPLYICVVKSGNATPNMERKSVLHEIAEAENKLCGSGER